MIVIIQIVIRGRSLKIAMTRKPPAITGVRLIFLLFLFIGFLILYEKLDPIGNAGGSL